MKRLINELIMTLEGAKSGTLPHACGTGRLAIGKPDSDDTTPCPSVQITRQ